MKELFTAYYDREKDEIHGCKEGSLIYLHEEGHRFLSPQFEEVYGVLNPLLALAMCVFMLESSNFFVQCFGLLSFVVLMVEEILAWVYAFRQKSSSMIIRKAGKKYNHD